MELRVLRYFLTVARVESITHAADILHVTQPTLSRQLADLEKELGTQLLIRGKRKVSLTDAGMLLLQRAEEILTIADKTEKEFKDQKNLVGGTISIGSVESLTSQVLSKLLKEFSAEYPQVNYHIFSGTGDDIKEKIDKGLLEVGMLLEPINIEKYNFIRLPQKERWGIFTQATSPLAQKEHVTPKDLIGVPLFISSRLVVQNEIANWFGDEYDHLHFAATYNLISNIVNLVENGMGTAICIEGILAMKDSNHLCFRPFYPELKFGCVIVWKKHKIFSEATNRFIQFINHALQA
ncbi:DNA-binding transcriptional regulator, LysR family [Paenibacillus sophorae]|uniref:DNA-binding transcriptional regulator, LysR family n=1 Tax=Paenibacillus sophorae TaxID=1333845 RepID=A0A1H8U8W3_9BACL|nr:LysR family transcriptional regulator [Paenibacillus sophorae]QWU18001.1 LysR family transcriptional regulator [Paenibacillus sophorae]SEO99497.1 DNA-binding transcriptional regulator, LysR family [Paenibacillus sophorae]